MFTIAMVSASCALADTPPGALTRTAESRLQLRTAVVEWSRIDHRLPNPARVFYNSRVAGEDLICTEGGDASGAVLRDIRSGKPGRLQFGMRHVLYRDSEVWTHLKLGIEATVESASDGWIGLPDARVLGLSPATSFVDLEHSLRPAFESSAEQCRCSEGRSGALALVTCRFVDGNEVEYWIDPDRGWNAVRIVERSGEDVLRESRIELSEFDGVWFPSRIENFETAFENGAKPAEVIDVRSAEFNRPEHPRRLSPPDIDVDVGTLIRRVGDKRAPAESGLWYWDGAKLVDQAEYLRRRVTGELREGPKYLQAVAHNRAQTQRLLIEGDLPTRWIFAERGDRPAAWTHREFETVFEAYTREFIERFSLDEDQVQHAQSILAECSEHARAYVEVRQAEFDQLEKDIRELRGQLWPEVRPRADALRERAARLMWPLDEIMDHELRPRLETLPTRAQRRAASQPARQASRPAGAP